MSFKFLNRYLDAASVSFVSPLDWKLRSIRVTAMSLLFTRDRTFVTGFDTATGEFELLLPPANERLKHLQFLTDIVNAQ